jgi:hypothetical protein
MLDLLYVVLPLPPCSALSFSSMATTLHSTKICDEKIADLLDVTFCKPTSGMLTISFSSRYKNAPTGHDPSRVVCSKNQRMIL